MKIIPAIDIIGGKCVRLTQGDYSQVSTYADDPSLLAEMYQKKGFSRLHVVDLDGAKASHTVNISTIESICHAAKGLKVDASGGIKSDADIDAVFAAGASYACIGSNAYTDPAKTMEWIERYGAERIIIGADVKDEYICTHGWKNKTDCTIYQLIERYEGRIRRLMCTDIAKDGMLGGTAVALYDKILKRYPDITLIASGGVASLKDLDELSAVGVREVIVGKAIYENKITLDQLLEYEDR